jgi:hypothetical protein
MSPACVYVLQGRAGQVLLLLLLVLPQQFVMVMQLTQLLLGVVDTYRMFLRCHLS